MNELKSVRRDIATNENVPAYVILADSSLMEIATYLPQSLDELRLISGFGDIKLARYGREFLAPVKSYCAQKGLSSKIDRRRNQNGNVSYAPNVQKSLAEIHAVRALTNIFQVKTVAEIAAARNLATTTIEGAFSLFCRAGRNGRNSYAD